MLFLPYFDVKSRLLQTIDTIAKHKNVATHKKSPYKKLRLSGSLVFGRCLADAFANSFKLFRRKKFFFASGAFQRFHIVQDDSVYF